MVVAGSNHKGNVAELAIATEAAKLGLSVLKPLTEHERYDLAIGIAGKLVRVQCKWAQRRGRWSPSSSLPVGVDPMDTSEPGTRQQMSMQSAPIAKSSTHAF
jgi:hypothetical protein